MGLTLTLVDAKSRVSKASLNYKRPSQFVPEAVGNPINVYLELRCNAMGVP